jgi:uncharacterized membrane protein YjjP (DUF1212 family)
MTQETAGNQPDIDDTIQFPHISMGELSDQGLLPRSVEGLALELALRVGDLLQSSGMSVADTVVVMRRICHAYGLVRAQIDITYNAISASYYPGGGLPPFTSLRTVSPAVPNLAKVADLSALVRRIEAGLPIGRATREFDALREAPPPYPGWVAWLAGGAISATVQLLYATSPRVLLIALVTGVLLNRFVALLARFNLPVFFQQLAGGWLVVCFAAAFSWVNRAGSPDFLYGVSPTLVAVGCIFQLVVGMKFVSAVQDAIDGFVVTAAGRTLQVLMLTAGLVVGLVTGLDLASRVGVEVYIAPTPIRLGPLVPQFVSAAATALVYVVASFANRKTAVLAALAALLAWLGYTLALRWGIGQTMANGIGALAAAFFATFLVRRTHIPGFAAINGAVIPLVPGLTLYYGLIQTVGTHSTVADPDRGLATLGLAAGIALSLAAGASLGTFLGRPAGDRLMEAPKSWYDRMRARRAG